MLSINHTLLIQIANFLFLLFVLNILLYKPIRRMIAQRRDRIESLEGSVEKFEAEAEERDRQIDESKVQARKQGFAEKEKFKEEGQEQEKQLLGEAGRAVEAKHEQARKEMETKMADVRKALDEQVAGFSKEFAEKVLGRSVQ